MGGREGNGGLVVWGLVGQRSCFGKMCDGNSVVCLAGRNGRIFVGIVDPCDLLWDKVLY